MSKFSASQRRYIRRRSRAPEHDPSELSGELNIIPFLDIVVNLIMFLLMTTATVAFFTDVKAQLPPQDRGTLGPRPTLQLSVMVTERGIIVAGSGAKLAPGCNEPASGRVITVPTRMDGSQDWSALTACMAKVKAQFPQEEQVIVSADAMVGYESMIGAMDAVRANAEGELFPNVLISAGLR